MSRALVTGATGMVGSHIVERLVADGWSVRALMRDTAAASWLRDAGAELARGDFSRDNPFTSERARKEFGWLPTVRPEVGIPDAFAWWREHRT